MDDKIKKEAQKILNEIMELELAGVVRYTHYSLMVYGYNRIPIVTWLKAAANESLLHATEAGEIVTMLGGHPSLKIGPLLETEQHEIEAILRESLEHEMLATKKYYELMHLVDGKSVIIEEYARKMIHQEEMHQDEVNKMLRSPGDVKPFGA